jgi:hypothetical protein
LHEAAQFQPRTWRLLINPVSLNWQKHLRDFEAVLAHDDTHRVSLSRLAGDQLWRVANKRRVLLRGKQRNLIERRYLGSEGLKVGFAEHGLTLRRKRDRRTLLSPSPWKRR